jgi:hypothetical protein
LRDAVDVGCRVKAQNLFAGSRARSLRVHASIEPARERFAPERALTIGAERVAGRKAIARQCLAVVKVHRRFHRLPFGRPRH